MVSNVSILDLHTKKQCVSECRNNQTQHEKKGSLLLENPARACVLDQISEYLCIGGGGVCQPMDAAPKQTQEK